MVCYTGLHGVIVPCMEDHVPCIDTWGCGCRKPEGTQTSNSESVSACTLQIPDALCPFVPTASKHKAFRDPAHLGHKNGCFRMAQVKGHARHQQLVIFSRPQQRNYLAIWQTSPDAQEVIWGNSEELAGLGLHRPPPPLR